MHPRYAFCLIFVQAETAGFGHPAMRLREIPFLRLSH